MMLALHPGSMREGSLGVVDEFEIYESDWVLAVPNEEQMRPEIFTLGHQ
jgi:hypothetical protein